MTVTVTDNNGATAQTSFTLQVLSPGTLVPPTPIQTLPPAITPPAPTTVTAPTPVTATAALTLLTPTVDCSASTLTFRTSGGDGTPIEYFAAGLTVWSTNPTVRLETWQRVGTTTYTLHARQSGKEVGTLDYTPNCLTTPTPPATTAPPSPPANKVPVLVTAIGSQTATLARAYSLAIPATTFTDLDGQLVSWAVSNLPVGLSFDAGTRVISGTPLLVGSNVVTVTVTDNNGATMLLTFTLQVVDNKPQPLTMTTPDFDCITGVVVFKTAGGDGTPIDYFAVGIKPWSSSPVGFIDPWQRKGVTFHLQARQSNYEVTYDYTTTCSTTSASGSRLASPEATPETVTWQAWPNPFEQELTITVPATVKAGQLRVNLTTISGLNQETAIESTRVEEGKLRLSMPKLQSGLYFLRIYDGDQPVQTLKVLKK